MSKVLQKWFVWLTLIGADPADENDIRLNKSLLVVCAVPFVFAGLGWGAMYFALGERLAGMIPFSYGIFSVLSITHFGLTRRYQFFRFSQLTLILLLPNLLMLSLGGFVPGSAVIIWALICPMGAMLFDEPRRAPYWFGAFIALVVIGGLIQPYLNYTSSLSTNWLTFFFVINLVGVSAFVFSMVYYFVLRKNEFQSQSESLLLNILPKEIVALLRDQQRTIADQFESTSILFADVVDFTLLSATMSPKELVKMLNEVFSQMDVLTDKYGLEKIKTIGDCYMVAAGVPRPRTDHAQALAAMALEMREYMNSHEFSGHKLNLRYGINSGPAVAGVIGRRKFSYDLWGEAVNTASRMESHGQPGAIQITQATYELSKDQFHCEHQGTVDVKGLGATEVWFLMSRKETA